MTDPKGPTFWKQEISNRMIEMKSKGIMTESQGNPRLIERSAMTSVSERKGMRWAV